MGSSLLKFRSLALMVAAATLILGIACGSSDPAAAPAAPTPDLAKIIQDAVSSVPQGASAAEIQKMVGDTVAASMAGQQGITKADVEAAVNAASAGSLSAADVQRIVDTSVSSLPVPKIDTSAITGLVQSAVAASVPDSVSAAEIQKMVSAAVTAAQAGAVTRGDLDTAD